MESTNKHTSKEKVKRPEKITNQIESPKRLHLSFDNTPRHVKVIKSPDVNQADTAEKISLFDSVKKKKSVFRHGTFRIPK